MFPTHGYFPEPCLKYKVSLGAVDRILDCFRVDFFVDGMGLFYCWLIGWEEESNLIKVS